MDDMTALERQIGDELRREIGPVPRFDAASIVHSVVTTVPPERRSVVTRLRGRISRTPTEGGLTMSSALKFIAASAIVALFGGFLLAGIISTQPIDETTPAVVTESPSPMTSEELLAGMVAEEVEPGVYRVINDGVRELVPADYWGVVAGQDGSVWLESTGQWLQLGEADRPISLGHVAGESVVAADGSLWAIAADNVYSFDGGSWTKWSTDSMPLRGLAMAPDGAVWVTGGEESGETAGLFRLAGGDLTPMPDWTEVHSRAAGASHLEVAPDGAVWLMGEETPDLPGYDNGGPRVDAFLRFDGDAWEAVTVPVDLRYVAVGQSFDIGADGTLWAAVGNPKEPGDGLARLDESGWTVFTEADGVRPWGIFGFFPTDLLHAAPDGSAWVNAEGDGSSCGGVANFDGTTWTGFLSDLCVGDMDVAPDGAVWVQAGPLEVSDTPGFDEWGSPHTYVITPEAVAGTE